MSTSHGQYGWDNAAAGVNLLLANITQEEVSMCIYAYRDGWMKGRACVCGWGREGGGRLVGRWMDGWMDEGKSMCIGGESRWVDGCMHGLVTH
jgi:hypothetical protein